MPRTAATVDVFLAIAEPQRRKIIELIAPRGRSVNDIAEATGLPQPQTSKHLQVLKKAGLVEVQVFGTQRIYTLKGDPLRQVQEWTRQIESCWLDRFDQLDDLLAELKQKEKEHPPS